MNFLEKKFGITIDYDENVEVTTIKNNKGLRFIFSGEMLKIIEEMAKLDGLSQEDLQDDLKMQSYLIGGLENAISIVK